MIPEKDLGGGLVLSTDPERQDVDAIHAYLTRSYWAEGIPRDVVERSLRGSLCAGVFHDGRQVAFARAITDRATYAYLCDVYVLEAYRGRGLGKRLMESIMQHPDLQGLRRWNLVTRDAHGLYGRFGFTSVASPGRYMELLDRDVYRRKSGGGEAGG